VAIQTRYSSGFAVALATAGLASAGTADAALMNGFSDASFNTSVFISVVERNSTNQTLRNLVIDTGTRTLDAFGGVAWSTTPEQETQILAFLASAAATSSVLFNVGGGLNDQSFSTDLQGFLTTGDAAGPAVDGFAQLGTAITNIDTFIGDTQSGTFNAAGVLSANAAIDPGWHNVAWGSDVGGGIEVSNEVLFGQAAALTGWKTDPSFAIIRSALGGVESNLLTGDISFTAIPLPGAAWLIAPGLGLLTPWIRRRKAG
jgi:hypothetical protein